MPADLPCIHGVHIHILLVNSPDNGNHFRAEFLGSSVKLVNDMLFRTELLAKDGVVLQDVFNLDATA